MKFREGRLVQTSHDRDIEGSPGAVNRNLMRVELNGHSPLKEKGHRRNNYLSRAVLRVYYYAKKGGTTEITLRPCLSRTKGFLYKFNEELWFNKLKKFSC